ncbi:MAG: hypothetical protein PHE73_04145 [Sulfurovaceae bacterium]|nr:hypothetical protein [Sulfurovaceae bacterium]
MKIEIMETDNNLLEKLYIQKEIMLKEYKSLQEPMALAENNFEKSLIEEKRALLAKEIKALSAQINELKEV